MRTVYITRPNKRLLDNDPVLARCGFLSVQVLEVEGLGAEAQVLMNLKALVPQTDETHAAVMVVILDAFVGTEPGRFEGGTTWGHSKSEVDTLLQLTEDDWEGKGCSLLSLRLAWRAWATFGERIRILVTTNGVKIDPRARFALAQAFGEGMICRLYDWSVSGEECKYLVDEVAPLVASGGQR